MPDRLDDATVRLFANLPLPPQTPIRAMAAELLAARALASDWTGPAIQPLTDGSVPTIHDLCASLDRVLHGRVVARSYSPAHRWRELLEEVAALAARREGT